MLRYRISLLIATLLPLPAAAQTNISLPTTSPLRAWGAGFNFGVLGFAPAKFDLLEGSNYFERTYRYGVARATDNDGEKRLVVVANTSWGIHGGYLWEDKNRKGTTGIRAEIQRNKACYTFSLPFRFGNNGDSLAEMVQLQKYYKAALAVERSFLINSYTKAKGEQHLFIREAFGYGIQRYRAGKSPVVAETEDWIEGGTGMRSTVLNVNKQSYILSSEIGMRTYSENKHRSFDMSIAFHLPFSKALTEQYELFQNNTSVGKSNITYGGSTIMVNSRYTFNRMPKPKSVEPKPDPGPIPDPVVILKDTSDRAVDVQSRFSTKSKTIKIRVWDRDEVDGDEISLYLNGELITSHLPLKRHKKRFKLHLEQGKNYLVMKAENLGTIPPNTAAFELKDGRNKRNITLTSDEGKSGAVEITR